MIEADFLIIGGGMAGASAGYFLSEHGRVVVLERESQPGYHTTGRSAALYSETYGNPVIRALSSGGRPFFENPPAGFAESHLLTRRGALYLGNASQIESLDRSAEQGKALVDSVYRMDSADVLKTIPLLRPDYVAGGVMEPDAMDIDVHGLHMGFLKGIKSGGGQVVTDSDVAGLVLGDDGTWTVDCGTEMYRSPVVVNAAGAWCDDIASLAGADRVGLVPKRRTVIQFAPPADAAIDGYPACIDVDEEFYFKPDAGTLLGSPADETPSPPCDAQPEDLDVAVCVDRITKAADIDIRQIRHRWAGLRSFVADKTPVVGFDSDKAGFFWLAGQGGYGIQTAPALGRLAASLAVEQGIPGDLRDRGVTEAALSPRRYQAADGA